ncbi:helix-turn-helix transcriptional regulator [Chromobacterium violaceum]|uniref:helix-turn-helix transcriptional regulator n=1 Tax=Chromobacterium violaceum TaxID=536 RepID=UPI0015FBC8E3|nr:response regulator transcription factor [Chromobacterium violaceum]MBA8737424.1 response regulator transcription factor [Chromobacterium violaceum]
MYQAFELSEQDKKFLQSSVAHFTAIATAVPEIIIGVKNLNSEHLYCSPHYLNLLDLKLEDVCGEIVIQPYKTSISNNLIIAEDKLVILERGPRSYLLITSLRDGVTPRMVVKLPIINPATDNVVGIVYFFHNFPASPLGQQMRILCNKLNQGDISNETLIKLSKREKQVIFFFLANLSSQEIADHLCQIEQKKISKSTIDSIFNEQLYSKFEVGSRSALYSKLINLGFNRMIPLEVLNEAKTLFSPLKDHFFY